MVWPKPRNGFWQQGTNRDALQEKGPNPPIDAVSGFKAESVRLCHTHFLQTVCHEWQPFGIQPGSVQKLLSCPKLLFHLVRNRNQCRHARNLTEVRVRSKEAFQLLPPCLKRYQTVAASRK